MPSIQVVFLKTIALLVSMKQYFVMFLLLAGGLVVVLIPVVIAVVSSVVSAVAAAQDIGEDE